MLIEGITKHSKISVYSRKSREDEDTDALLKHRDRLLNFIKEQGFINVTWYEEVVSGSTIDVRFEFMKLLEKVKTFQVDLVICVDFDRITRGDSYERGVIERAFKSSQTRIYTLDGQIIDFNDDNSVLQIEVKGLLSNYELRQITKRMINGKKDTVKKGIPHSGSAPFGYIWDRNSRQVLVNEEEKEVYRLMVEWYINDGYSFGEIARRLERLNIKTRRGFKWYPERVSKLLQNEFHLGYVVYGEYKSEKTNRVNEKGQVIYKIGKNKDTDSIQKTMGKHIPIKTPEEHAKILKKMKENSKYGHANKSTDKIHEFKLKGLIRCPYCNASCPIVHRMRDALPLIRKCGKITKQRTDKCKSTRGVMEEVIYNEVIKSLKEYKEDLFSKSNEVGSVSKSSIDSEIEMIESSITKNKKLIDKEKEMFKADIIDIYTLKDDISKLEDKIRLLEEELVVLKQNQDYLSIDELDEKLNTWSSDDVAELLENPNNNKFTDMYINQILKSIINCATYIRTDDKIDITILYK